MLRLGASFAGNQPGQFAGVARVQSAWVAQGTSRDAVRRLGVSALY